MPQDADIRQRFARIEKFYISILKIKEVLSLEIIEATKIEAIQNNEPLEVEIEATEEQSIVVEKESDEPADTTESVSE